MPRKVKVYLEGGVNEDILKEFLQYVHDFNVKHSDQMHVNISFAAPWMSMDENLSLMRSIKPQMPYETVVPRESMTDQQKQALDDFLKG